MLSLAFECAGQGLSAALATSGGDQIGTTALNMDRGQPAALLPALHDLLDRHKLRPQDLDQVGCTLGPGGFTGIRLGIAAGLGLARSSGATFYGFNAFDVYALGEPEPEGLCIAIESRRREVFARVYARQGKGLAMADTVLSPEDLMQTGLFSRVIGSAASKLDPACLDQEPDMAKLARFMSSAPKNSAQLVKARDRSAPIYLRAPEIGGMKSS